MEIDLSIWNQQQTAQLSQALCLINDPTIMQGFLSDILTKKEIIDIASRLRAAQMLLEGKTYVLIAQETGLSSRTIARISDWLQNGTNGYQSVIALLEDHHTHTSPALAA